MIRRMFVLLLLVSLPFVYAQKKSSGKKEDFGNVHSITKEQLYDYLSFIASDELEGRDTPSRGLDIAAKFIATHLSRWGYAPAGDNGTYFQRIPLLRTRVIPAQTFVEVNGRRFNFGADLTATSVAGVASAPLVYVQNGYILYKKNINPYEGIDVKGKIMIVAGGYPKGVKMADFGTKLGIDYDSPTNYAKEKGALAIITIPTAQTLTAWEKTKKSATEKGTLSVPAFKKPEEKSAVPVITASAQLVEALFVGEKTGVQSMFARSSSDSVVSFELSAGKKVTLSVAVHSESLSTHNVVAVLEGADAKLKSEYVAFGAHYDHVGIRSEPVNGDSIHNGADDDGSGTVGLMAMAEAFAKGTRPKRSLLFIWHTGEEKGLWGSKYFTQFPTVPLNNIVTMLNIDMIGRSKTAAGADSANDDFTGNHEVFSIGSKMMSTELGTLNEQVNAALLNLKLNYKFDDPADPNRLFYRSDHYNYAKNGIPIVFYFDGIHEDYHKVSDEIDKIDFDKLMKVTKSIFALGWKVAQLPKRPVVDKEFSRDILD